MASCALCQTTLPALPLIDEERAFCCSGCLAVYRILEVKEELEGYRSHPLFQKALAGGLIANPQLIEELAAENATLDSEEWVRFSFMVEGMWCPSCAEVIRLLLLRKKGVRHCQVDYATDLASVEFAPRSLSKERIFEELRAFGYSPHLFEEKGSQKMRRALFLRFLVALFFSVNIMMFSYPLYASHWISTVGGWDWLFGWFSCAAALPILGYSAWPIFRRCASGLKVGWLGMECLVSLGVSSAFFLSLISLVQGKTTVYFDSMAMVVTLVLLGKMMEGRAKRSAKESLVHLFQTLPKRGRKWLAEGREQFVPLKEVEVGDYLVVLAGEKVVLDGVVEEGEGLCDESAMTGEPLPAVKRVGAPLLSGSLLQQGWLRYRVTTTEERSFLRQMVESVRGDLDQRAPPLRPIDLVVSWFVPSVVLLAFAVGMVTADPLRAIAILLISCPCAIGIAAPLVEARLIFRLAEKGVIVRNRRALSALAQMSVCICDKTGTVTEGRFEVVSGIDNLAYKEKAALAALASRSSHPIAVAISRALSQASSSLAEGMQEILGEGISAEVDGIRYFLGSLKFIRRYITCSLSCEEASEILSSIAYFASEKGVIARLVLADVMREGAPSFVTSLSPARRVLLSGDRESAVQLVAERCGFDQFFSEKNPMQKRELVQQLRHEGEVVCMIGDGVNDAPAQAAADLAVCVVNGTELSAQLSDLLLTSHRLGIVAEARDMALLARRIGAQNLFWAFFYNGIGIGLAVFGLLTPLFAAAAMVMSSLIVVANARRL